MALQCSILNSVRIWLMNLSWLMVRSFLSLHLQMWQPSNHSVLPLLVMVNLFWIWVVVRLDSTFELDARRRSLTLVAEMEMPVADCNQPGVSGSSNDWYAPVSSGTGHYNSLFVLPVTVPCTISFGATMCSLTHLFPPYCCPVSCSLYCIGMTCGGPCLALDY